MHLVCLVNLQFRSIWGWPNIFLKKHTVSIKKPCWPRMNICGSNRLTVFNLMGKNHRDLTCDVCPPILTVWIAPAVCIDGETMEACEVWINCVTGIGDCVRGVDLAGRTMLCCCWTCCCCAMSVRPDCNKKKLDNNETVQIENKNNQILNNTFEMYF